jgi:hypothetical protein
VPHNKGMKLSKPEYLGGSWPRRSGIIESDFAAYAPCWADMRGPVGWNDK